MNETVLFSKSLSNSASQASYHFVAQLARRLTEQAKIAISHRTVAKYRKALGITACYGRRSIKATAAA